MGIINALSQRVMKALVCIALVVTLLGVSAEAEVEGIQGDELSLGSATGSAKVQLLQDDATSGVDEEQMDTVSASSMSSASAPRKRLRTLENIRALKTYCMTVKSSKAKLLRYSSMKKGALVQLILRFGRKSKQNIDYEYAKIMGKLKRTFKGVNGYALRYLDKAVVFGKGAIKYGRTKGNYGRARKHVATFNFKRIGLMSNPKYFKRLAVGWSTYSTHKARVNRSTRNANANAVAAWLTKKGRQHRVRYLRQLQGRNRRYRGAEWRLMAKAALKGQLKVWRSKGKLRPGIPTGINKAQLIRNALKKLPSKKRLQARAARKAFRWMKRNKPSAAKLIRALELKHRMKIDPCSYHFSKRTCERQRRIARFFRRKAKRKSKFRYPMVNDWFHFKNNAAAASEELLQSTDGWKPPSVRHLPPRSDRRKPQNRAVLASRNEKHYRTIENIRALKAYCVAVKEGSRSADDFEKLDGLKNGPLVQLIIRFGNRKSIVVSKKEKKVEPWKCCSRASKNIVNEYARIMGRLKRKFTGVTGYVLQHLDQAVVFGKGAVKNTMKTTQKGKLQSMASFNFKKIGLMSYPRYFKKLAVAWKTYLSSKSFVDSVTRSADANAVASWLVKKGRQHRVQFLRRLSRRNARHARRHWKLMERSALRGQLKSWRRKGKLQPSVPSGINDAQKTRNRLGELRTPSKKRMQARASKNALRWMRRHKKSVRNLIEDIESKKSWSVKRFKGLKGGRRIRFSRRSRSKRRSKRHPFARSFEGATKRMEQRARKLRFQKARAQRLRKKAPRRHRRFARVRRFARKREVEDIEDDDELSDEDIEDDDELSDVSA